MKTIKQTIYQVILATTLSICSIQQKLATNTPPANNTSKDIVLTQELCKAAYDRDLEKTEQLISQGASINAHDNQGYTPLHHALQSPEKKLVKIVKILLDHGADIDSIAQNSITPLDLALTIDNRAVQDLVLAKFVNKQSKVKSAFPVEISFMIADIKYNHGVLKICEFGQGSRSYFKGHEHLFGIGKIWEELWNYLKQFNLPIWYVGTKPESSQFHKEIAYKTLIDSGGSCVPSLYELHKDTRFKKQQANPIHNKNLINNYRGIIILRHHKEPRGSITQFRRENPGFLILDSATGPFVNSKYQTSTLFLDEDLQSYKPRWKSYPKKYNNTLAQTIINDLQCDTVVIKPLDSANGWGVIIAHKDELQEVLKNFLIKKNIVKFDKDFSYSYWRKDVNKEFIVEEYVPSHHLTVHNKQYDPTMRMVFIITYDNEKINISFLGGYWKLPTHAVNDRGTLTDRHKSKIGSNKAASIKIDDKDIKEVKKILLTMLPKVYAKMLVTKPKNR